MKTQLHVNGRTFEIVTELIDATSICRPDPSWRHIDAAGHEHRYRVNGAPASTYDPRARYEVPTAERVGTGEYDEDGIEYTRLACRLCGADVQPGTTADGHTVHVAGLRRAFVDGRPVTRDEFAVALAAELSAAPSPIVCPDCLLTVTAAEPVGHDVVDVSAMGGPPDVIAIARCPTRTSTTRK